MSSDVSRCTSHKDPCVLIVRKQLASRIVSGRQTCVGTCHPACTSSTKQGVMLQMQCKNLEARRVDS